jgi:general nucleoside transport system ATP-binding protein
VAQIGQQFGLEVTLDPPVEALAVGERQRLEIVKCLLGKPGLLVLDEPTAVLPPPEVQSLLKICRNIAAHGCGILLVAVAPDALRSVRARCG